MHRIEFNVITGERREVELTPEEIAALQAAAPAEAMPALSAEDQIAMLNAQLQAIAAQLQELQAAAQPVGQGA